MVGAVGFEPTHDGVKVRCLTAWLHPNLTKKLLGFSAGGECAFGAEPTHAPPHRRVAEEATYRLTCRSRATGLGYTPTLQKNS